MQNEIVINAERGETRVAVLERSVFSELHIERTRDKSVVGSVFKGRVMRVLPGMQAAFVDVGLEKAAFLYAGDYVDEDRLPEDGPRRRGRNGGRREPPRIDTMLEEGQEIVVQVAKEPIGTKGARIISQVSIPGRHLVLTPWSGRVGVSRRIESDKERRRLKEIVNRLRPPELGFIIRTAGDGVREADLEADVRYLANVWQEIQRARDEAAAPSALYEELDLPLRVIRDFANDETKRVVIDDRVTYEKLKGFVEKYMAEPQPRIEHFRGKEPIFDHFGLEPQIHGNIQRKVWLKSGGSLMIDQSEALTAIDVNTGRYVGKRDLEETVLKTNLEAVKEVVHQLRFRNIGGLIIIDLIDMEAAENREKVYRALQEAIRGDKAKTNILKISELGLVEMTRKRTRENLVQTLCEPCPYCESRGYVLSVESVAYKVLREVRKDLPRFCGRQIALSVAPPVAEALLGRERESLAGLEQELGRQIEVRARPGLHQEQFEVVALDQGPPVAIALRWLEEAPAEPEVAPESEAALQSEATPESVAAAESVAAPESEIGAEGVEGLPGPAGDEATAATQALDAAREHPILPPSQPEAVSSDVGPAPEHGASTTRVKSARSEGPGVGGKQASGSAEALADASVEQDAPSPDEDERRRGATARKTESEES